MTDIKLCKDCKHYKKDWGARLTGYGDTFDLCLHPLVTENIVTGKSNGRYCDSVRKYYKCGMEGKLFEVNHPSYYCPKCGEQIGWLGRFFNFFIPNYHKCNKPYKPKIVIDNSGASEWVNSAEYFMSDEGREFLKEMNKFFNEHKVK